MKLWLRKHPAQAVFLALFAAYVICTSGMASVALTNFPSPDPRPAPGLVAETAAFVIGGILFSAFRLLFPMALAEGDFEHGAYAFAQLPIVLTAVVLTVIFTVWQRNRLRTIILAALFTYMAAMLATNDAAGLFKVDHSGDFPLGKQLNALDWRKKPMEADVRKIAGAPMAEGVFPESTDLLPIEVLSSMSQRKRTEAKIYAYQETSRWSAATYYVLFDPATGEHFSTVTLYRGAPPQYWPGRR